MWFYSKEDSEYVRGFRKLIVADPGHPYAETWWPPGHLLGYEHSFVHAVNELLQAMTQGRSQSPSFLDGTLAQAVLEAVSLSAAENTGSPCSRWNARRCKCLIHS